MKPVKEVPRWPTYRWTCDDCDAGEGGQDLPMLRRHAQGHVEDQGHTIDLMKVLVWYSPRDRKAPR